MCLKYLNRVFFPEHKYHSLPLFGHFCCRLAAQPDCISKEMGISNVKIDDQDYWTRLQGFYIKMWESKKHAEEGQNPEHVIPINKVSWQLCRYIYTFPIVILLFQFK